MAFLLCFHGGGRGIRTPVGLHPNGFQDRRVMTTSLALHIEKYIIVVVILPRKRMDCQIEFFVNFAAKLMLFLAENGG